MAEGDVFGTVLQTGAAIITIAVVTLVLVQFFGTITLAGTGSFSDDAEIVDGTGQIGSPEGATLTEQQVTMTRGTALSLDGTPDADVSVSDSVSVTNDQWTACTHARVESGAVGADANRTLMTVEGATLFYNGSAGATGNWTVHYYDRGNTSSAALEVNATAPTGLTSVCFERDDNSLELARNTTATASGSVPASGSVALPSQSNWNGTVEETRVWDYTHNSSQRSEYVQNASLAIAGEPPQVRVMYDSADTSVSSVPAYFAGGSVDISGGSLVSGGATAPGVTEGDEVRVGGPGGQAVTVDSSTFLDANGEVVFVDASAQAYGAIMATLQRIGGAALGLLVIGLLAMAARAMLDPLGGF